MLIGLGRRPSRRRSLAKDGSLDSSRHADISVQIFDQSLSTGLLNNFPCHFKELEALGCACYLMRRPKITKNTANPSRTNGYSRMSSR